MSTSATPGFAGGSKADAQAELASLGDEVALLQKQLFAQGRAGGSRRLLLVLQGMDTSGKGVPPEQWATRYDVINCFEARLSATTKVVCRCNAEAAPWYVVGLVWPAPSGWDPDTERARLRELAA